MFKRPSELSPMTAVQYRGWLWGLITSHAITPRQLAELSERRLFCACPSACRHDVVLLRAGEWADDYERRRTGASVSSALRRRDALRSRLSRRLVLRKPAPRPPKPKLYPVGGFYALGSSRQPDRPPPGPKPRPSGVVKPVGPYRALRYRTVGDPLPNADDLRRVADDSVPVVYNDRPGWKRMRASLFGDLMRRSRGQD